MRVIIAAAGTGGHINPGIAIANEIKRQEPNSEIIFVGTNRGLENDLVPRAGYKLEHINAYGFDRTISIENIKKIYQTFHSIKEAKKIIEQFKPDVVIGTGGYICVPIGIAAQKRKVPVVLHESNAFPGVAVKILSNKAKKVLVGFEDAKKRLPKAKQVVVTGTPTKVKKVKISEERKKELLKENKVMAKHLHIPLQSGSNKILKLMNRRYNKEEFLSMVDNLKDIPDISLTTDLIVGFPNEGEEEFNETIDTLKKIGFTKIHTFPYSKRKGTPAAIMDNQVSPEEKKKRVHRILDLSNKYEHNFYESKIGKIYDGVVEVHSNGTTIVHTSNFIPVIINDVVEEGTIVDVKIEKVENLKVYGRIV